MRELPKYAFLTNPAELNGMLVIMLERPYMIASIYECKVADTERVESFMSAKAQGRYPVGKVKGYTVFLKMYTSLEPCNDSEYQQTILDEMAEFVLTERIQKKIGQFRMSDESGRTIQIHEQSRDRAIRLRKRKQSE